MAGGECLGSLTYGGNFSVSGFVDVGGGEWEYTDGGATWSYSQLSGTLTLVTVPEPSMTVLALSGLFLVGVGARRRLRDCA